MDKIPIWLPGMSLHSGNGKGKGGSGLGMQPRPTSSGQCDKQVVNKDVNKDNNRP